MQGTETSDLLTLVPPLFNQLTVFDPRMPHGVRVVEGTRDPCRGRLVLHGWFTQPAPFFQGVLLTLKSLPSPPLAGCALCNTVSHACHLSKLHKRTLQCTIAFPEDVNGATGLKTYCSRLAKITVEKTRFPTFQKQCSWKLLWFESDDVN